LNMTLSPTVKRSLVTFIEKRLENAYHDKIDDREDPELRMFFLGKEVAYLNVIEMLSKVVIDG